jgi:hypothetical protein
MRVLILAFAFAFLGAAALARADEGAIETGDLAPPFSATDHLGRPVSLDELRQRGPVVVDLLRSPT